MHCKISAALIIATIGSSIASAHVSQARTVQLIPMAAADTQQTIFTGSPGETQPLTTERPFRIYELSRRWVQFQITDKPGRAQPDDNEPEQDATPISYVTEQSAIPIWMRGDTLGPTSSAVYLPGCQSTAYRPAGFLKPDAELRRERYFALMSIIACENGIPVGLFDAMIIQESRYDPLALSSRRAFGLAQLMPGTAAWLGVDRFDISDNLRGGARYLRAHLDRFGRYDLALAAYNAGPGRIQNGSVPAITETRSYVGRILDYWVRLSGAAADNQLPSSRKSSYANRQSSLVRFGNSY
ncbi:Transglycosylase SLT domain-containing protein [Sphingobium sp. AP50]|uniref:lytic transglycosylase domain-containing protein n=1 Tax=Sphingobium sp. AP50 TaxID=1884369 RepID=UPI0008D6659F|nr:lytic transglycosylase domain-containing protein [Sphingobium sp. AP50]SEK04036.1 Transglycosylase SLT domain-containing protein [Sphingobium sp. AP50]